MHIVEKRKKRVLQQIVKLSNEEVLKQIENLLNQASNDFSFIQKYVRPIQKKTDVAALIKAKNYNGVNKQKLKQITQSFDVPQSTDELLQML